MLMPNKCSAANRRSASRFVHRGFEFGFGAFESPRPAPVAELCRRNGNSLSLIVIAVGLIVPSLIPSGVGYLF